MLPFAIAVPHTLPWVQTAARAARSGACVLSRVRPERKPLSKHLAQGKTHLLARMAKNHGAGKDRGRCGDHWHPLGRAPCGASLSTCSSARSKRSAMSPSLSPPSPASGLKLLCPISWQGWQNRSSGQDRRCCRDHWHPLSRAPHGVSCSATFPLLSPPSHTPGSKLPYPVSRQGWKNHSSGNARTRSYHCPHHLWDLNSCIP